jgi:carboxypeptidase C (cathepsin A)
MGLLTENGNQECVVCGQQRWLTILCFFFFFFFFFLATGPWRVQKDQTLKQSPTSWNRLANMLFIESPAGVGYSYDLSSSRPTTGDNQTSHDLYTFLADWTQNVFPEYRSRDLYISGESYGGHYVPQLSYEIIQQNKKAGNTKLNLQGMLVGKYVVSNHYQHCLSLYDTVFCSIVRGQTISSTAEHCCHLCSNTRWHRSIRF